MIKRFGATSDQAEALFARARWLVKDSADASEVFRRLTPVIQRTCGATERADLIEMLDAVARADSSIDDIVTQDIAKFARTLEVQMITPDTRAPWRPITAGRTVHSTARQMR